MSVTVHSEGIQYSSFSWDQSLKDLFKLRSKAWISLPITHNGQKKNLFITFDAGYICDGLSVPWFFKWFLKNWDETNDLYNLAGVVHDALYCRKGFNIFTRDECDDIFRGLLRISGQDRFHASTADFILRYFGKTHWGDDSYHCKDKFCMSFT